MNINNCDTTTVKLPGLRITTLNRSKVKLKTNSDIKISFVFSHDKHIRSYFYARDDWIHVFHPKATKKYLKYNNNLATEFFDGNIKVIHPQIVSMIDSNFEKQIKKNILDINPIAILCDNNTIFRKILDLDSKKYDRAFIGLM